MNSKTNLATRSSKPFVTFIVAVFIGVVGHNVFRTIYSPTPLPPAEARVELMWAVGFLAGEIEEFREEQGRFPLTLAEIEEEEEEAFVYLAMGDHFVLEAKEGTSQVVFDSSQQDLDDFWEQAIELRGTDF